jgi:4-aminobutyrate aminotransferase-like enzyme
MRMKRPYAGPHRHRQQEIIALRHGYSGRSAMGMTLTAHSPWRIGGTHILGIKHALNPYCYRCPLKLTYPSCGVACAEDVEDVIRTTTSGQIAAFLAEPIQGVGGFHHPAARIFQDCPRDYQAVWRPCLSATRCRPASAVPATNGLALSIGRFSRTS